MMVGANGVVGSATVEAHFGTRSIKRMRCVGGLALLLAAAIARVDGALHPVAQDIKNISSPEAVADHRSVVKEWFVQADGPSNDVVVRQLKLSIPGRTFVRPYTSDEEQGLFAGKQIAAVVKVMSDDAAVVDMFDVASEDNGELLHVRQPGSEWINGYLLVEIALAATTRLHTVNNEASSDVVVQDGALQASGVDKLVISNQGSGDIYIESGTQLQLGELQLRVDGSGDVQLSVPAGIIADKWVSGTDGSGDIRVFSGATNVSMLGVDIDSSGDICFQPESFQADKVTVEVDGSGDWTFAKPGHCGQSSLSVDGSGDIRAGLLVCDKAEVSVDGSGDVVFQATQEFDGSKYGSGDINYVGDAPLVMNKPHVAKPVRRDPKVRECKHSRTPGFHPVRMGFVFGPWGGPSGLHPNDLTVLTIIAFFAALYLWRERKERIRRRRQYEAQPLLSQGSSSVFV